MLREMKIVRKIVLLSLFIALLIASPQAAFGCSCREVESNKRARVSYKRWLKDFNGAVFTGRVLKAEKIEARYERKVTFEVERYWKGVEGAEVVIHTAMDGAACGAPFVEGERYFVIAGATGGRLDTDLCSYLGYTKNKAAYLKGLGKGKTPPKR